MRNNNLYTKAHSRVFQIVLLLTAYLFFSPNNGFAGRKKIDKKGKIEYFDGETVKFEYLLGDKTPPKIYGKMDGEKVSFEFELFEKLEFLDIRKEYRPGKCCRHPDCKGKIRATKKTGEVYILEKGYASVGSCVSGIVYGFLDPATNEIKEDTIPIRGQVVVGKVKELIFNLN